jgi:hypothetical protein
VIALTIDRAGFARDFNQQLRQAKNPVGMLKVAGRELANQLKTWFRAKDRSSANKLSERRSHFWLAVSRTVQNPEQTGYNSISVSVTHPAIAQKVFGGTITAKAAGALTLPVEERAYGRTAGNFEAETGLKLFLLKIGKSTANHFGNAVLAVKEAGHITVEYILTKSVTQPADPTALPPMTQLEAAILARSQLYLNNEVKLGANGTGQS